MAIARRGLKVRVKVVSQAVAVGPTSIEGRLFLVVTDIGEPCKVSVCSPVVDESRMTPGPSVL